MFEDRDPTDPRTPVPEDQRPGHHPDAEQDKPDMDAFAERLGVVPDDEEPDGAPHVEPGEATTGRRSRRRRPEWSPIGLALVGPVTGFFVVWAAVRTIRRRRR